MIVCHNNSNPERRTMEQEIFSLMASKPYEPNEELRAKLVKDIPDAVQKMSSAIDICYGLGLTAGWWHDAKTKEPKPDRNYGDITSLFHSEISESYEHYRKGTNDDHLPQYPGEVVELADLQIRLFDWVGRNPQYRQMFLDAMRDKLIYNTTRADHKMDARAADGGKKL